MKYLNSINSPADLRQLAPSQLRDVADEVRQHLIDTITKVGGHFGAGLGAVELTVALHYVYNTPIDKIVWDTGHQAYPHKILTGRRDSLHTIIVQGARRRSIQPVILASPPSQPQSRPSLVHENAVLRSCLVLIISFICIAMGGGPCKGRIRRTLLPEIRCRLGRTKRGEPEQGIASRLPQQPIPAHMPPEGSVHGLGGAAEEGGEMAVEEGELVRRRRGTDPFDFVQIEGGDQRGSIRSGFAMNQEGLGRVMQDRDEVRNLGLIQIAIRGDAVVVQVHVQDARGPYLLAVPVGAMILSAEIQDTADAVMPNDVRQFMRVQLPGAVDGLG